jgi:hypothetical protein
MPMQGATYEGVNMMQSVARHRHLMVLVAVIALIASVTWMAVANQARAGSATPVVYVATGESFPDALGAGPAATIVKGPVLLVSQNAIPGATATELARLAPDKIIIVGGTAVVSTNVEDLLKAYAGTVERIAGANRYETAAKLSAATFPATIDADTLDGRDSTAFVEHGEIEMTVSGNAWMGHDGNAATRWAAATSFSGAGAAVISLAGPVAIGGTAYGLESFDLCVITFGGGYVTAVSTVPINSFGPGVDDDQYINIPPNTTDRTTGCYTYTVDTPVGQGVGLMVQLDGTGSVELYAVKSTWTTTAAGG